MRFQLFGAYYKLHSCTLAPKYLLISKVIHYDVSCFFFCFPGFFLVQKEPPKPEISYYRGLNIQNFGVPYYIYSKLKYTPKPNSNCEGPCITVPL